MKTLFVALAILFVILSQGTKAVAEPSTGYDLIQLCQAEVALMESNDHTVPVETAFKSFQCLGYFMGVTQMAPIATESLSASGLSYCPPTAPLLDNNHAIKIVVEYMEKNPKELSLPAPILIFKALHKSFPCKPAKQEKKKDNDNPEIQS